MQSPDKLYWKNQLHHPYSPCLHDVSVYQSYLLPGKTLLLGCTHLLIPISDNQLDIDPWYDSESVIIGDWRNNTCFYDNIIGDGVLNFTQQLTDGVLRMASTHSRRMVVRAFNHKLEKMLIADYFPTAADFSITPDVHKYFTDYSFYVWNFK